MKEFTLIKGFTYAGTSQKAKRQHADHHADRVEYPSGHVDVLSSDDHVNVEEDGEMRAQ